MSLVIPASTSLTTSLPQDGILSITYPSSFMRMRTFLMLSNVSSPAAPPTWSLVGGYMFSSIATLLSEGSFRLRSAQAMASVAILSILSGTETERYSPSSPRLVNATGTSIICPSYSGHMTLVPISEAVMPMMSSFHASTERETCWACITGTPRSRKKFLASGDPSTLFMLICEKPMAITRASIRDAPPLMKYLWITASEPMAPVSSFGDDTQNTGTTLAPWDSSERTRSCIGPMRFFAYVALCTMTPMVGKLGSNELYISSMSMSTGRSGWQSPSVLPMTGPGTMTSDAPPSSLAIHSSTERRFSGPPRSRRVRTST